MPLSGHCKATASIDANKIATHVMFVFLAVLVARTAALARHRVCQFAYCFLLSDCDLLFQ